ncbi:MAG: hypothetical protein AAFV80_08670 [Bacteroidota bacterium]
MTHSIHHGLGLLSLFILIVFTACDSEIIDLPDDDPQAGPFFNQRYCEVLLAKVDTATGLFLEAYNTVGCNTCPEEEWQTINSDSLIVETGAPYVRLNGPRYWLLDSIFSSSITNSCDVTFGSLDMSFVASIPIVLQDFSTEVAYTINSVERNTVWYFNKGQEVYMLEDPTGKCFIMQSYSQKIDNNLQLEDLPILGNRLQLPAGWNYRSAILASDFALESQNGVAELVSDELENAYQYLPTGCL